MSATKKSKWTEPATASSLLWRLWATDHQCLDSYPFEPYSGKRAELQIDGMIQACEALAATDEPVWYHDRIGFHLTKRFRRIIYRMSAMDELLPESMFVGRRMDPQLSLLVPFFRKWGRRFDFWRIANDNIDVNNEVARRLVDHVAYCIRRLMRHRRINARLKDQQRRADERYISCAKVILALLQQFPRLLVLRIDLYFDGEAKQASWWPEARLAFEKFLMALRQGGIIPDVVEVISGIEDGFDRRVHFHVCVVCDGNRRQDGYALTEAMGRYWVEECVGSPALASSKNCWVRQSEYRFNGLGKVSYVDSRKLMGLREAIEYIVKYVRYGLPPVGYSRKLRKGQVPPIQPGRRRGAPRKHGYGLEVAERVLLTPATPVPQFLPLPRRNNPWLSPWN